MQQKISINQATYDKLKAFANEDLRSINKELEYIIKFYEDYLYTSYPDKFVRPGSPNPFEPYPPEEHINPADPLNLNQTPITLTRNNNNNNKKKSIITADTTVTVPATNDLTQTQKILISRITEYEQHMSDPNNEYYQKIKKYFMHTDPDLDAFNTLLALADDNNFPEIAREYDYAIKKALDISLTHELSRSDWKQIVGYLR